MLGEDHSLTKDFPEYQSTITKLNTDNEEFAARAKQYNAMQLIKKSVSWSYKMPLLMMKQCIN